MKTAFAVLVALLMVLIGCSESKTSAQTNSKTETVEINEDSYLLGETIFYENVAVVPLIKKDFDSSQDADYVTLAEAVKNDWIEIIEKPGDETVSELTVRYSGPKPLLLLAGELLLGGKQDRVVVEDTVIDPISTVVVSVYCVERGRWSGSSNRFSFSGGQVPSSVKKRAMLGNQTEVWAETAEFNMSAGYVTGGATTLDAGLSMKGVSDFRENGLNDLRAVLEGSDAIVGLVFIIDGKITTMEIFNHPRLLESSFDSIISGVLAEASVSSSESSEQPTRDEVLAFLKDAMDAQADMMDSEEMQQGGFNTFGGGRGGASSMGVSGAFTMSSPALSESDVAHGTYINEKD